MSTLSYRGLLTASVLTTGMVFGLIFSTAAQAQQAAPAKSQAAPAKAGAAWLFPRGRLLSLGGSAKDQSKNHPRR